MPFAVLSTGDTGVNKTKTDSPVGFTSCGAVGSGAGRWESLIFKPESTGGLLRVDEPLGIVDIFVCVCV